MPINLVLNPKNEVYNPTDRQREVGNYLKDRIETMKQAKKNVLNKTDFEEIMRAADREYIPGFLANKQSGTTILVSDETIGVRGSRFVNLPNQDIASWRSTLSEPTLMVKIQTALSILVDQNPEAVFKALTSRYKKGSSLAYALWKRNWEISRSKEQLKLFIFDLAKYGWAIGRTYPRIIKREVEILTELDPENPAKNKYRKRTITEFNDVWREKLDPYRAWIDDMTNLTDPWSCDDFYYEIDYSYDAANREMQRYKNWAAVTMGAKTDDMISEGDTNSGEFKQRTDIVTIGFYESKNKDLYAIYVPAQGIVLHDSPLPNDDKRLSCWWSYWNERDPRTPYGIGLYEILKHNKVLYDRFENMTLDQLTMAIYPMLFYTPQNNMVGTGDLTISPNTIREKMPGTTIEQVKIDYDPRGFEGVKFLSDRMDENTGITPTLQGEVQGKTLGEVLHAKDAALKRLNIPLANIASALEQEAYITLSWMNQIYSTPEVQEFSNREEFDLFMKEMNRQPSLVTFDEKGVIKADFFPEMELGIAPDREGNLIESPEDRFFRFGIDIPTEALRWEGKISIKAQSIIAPSQELERQRKMELFNLTMPIIGQIAQLVAVQPMVALAMVKPLIQIYEIQGEKPKDWLPDQVVELLDNPEKAKMATAAIAKAQQPGLFIPREQMANHTAGTPGPTQTPQDQAQSVVPRSEVSNPLRKTLGEIGKVR